MKEADEIYVLDTGSSDNTVPLLKKLGVNVYQKIIKPFRFDIARNESLNLVSNDTDICVCTDLDEVFVSGWRDKLENQWDSDITRGKYNYNWSFDSSNKPTVSFLIEKIHTRNNYKWINPVHEVLKYTGNFEKISLIKDICVNHYPDYNKSRNSYLPLLELSVKEDKKNDRNMHYLGREYMYYKKYDLAIKTLKRHLLLKSATWPDERCASMRFIARSYKELKNIKLARKWYLKSIKEAPYLRDGYTELAILEYEQKRYKKCIKYSLQALQIKEHEKTYINEVFSWDNTLYDLLSICFYYLDNCYLAVYFVDLALSFKPSDERLINNKKIFLDKIKSRNI